MVASGHSETGVAPRAAKKRKNRSIIFTTPHLIDSERAYNSFMYNTIKIHFAGGVVHLVFEERPSVASTEYEQKLRAFIGEKDKSTNILMHADERFTHICNSINEFSRAYNLESLHVRYVFEQK
jgi:hypothetical protein